MCGKKGQPTAVVGTVSPVVPSWTESHVTVSSTAWVRPGVRDDYSSQPHTYTHTHYAFTSRNLEHRNSQGQHSRFRCCRGLPYIQPSFTVNTAARTVPALNYGSIWTTASTPKPSRSMEHRATCTTKHHIGLRFWLYALVSVGSSPQPRERTGAGRNSGWKYQEKKSMQNTHWNRCLLRLSGTERRVTGRSAGRRGQGDQCCLQPVHLTQFDIRPACMPTQPPNAATKPGCPGSSLVATDPHTKQKSISTVATCGPDRPSQHASSAE